MAKQTSEGLPVVSLQTLEILLRDDHQRRKEGNTLLSVRDVLNNLKRENPAIYGIIKHTYNSTLQEGDEGSKRVAPQYLLGALFVYDSLRRQSEANKLEEDLG